MTACPWMGFPAASRTVTVTVPAWAGVSERDGGARVSVAAPDGFTATGPYATVGRVPSPTWIVSGAACDGVTGIDAVPFARVTDGGTFAAPDVTVGVSVSPLSPGSGFPKLSNAPTVRVTPFPEVSGPGGPAIV